LSGTTGAGNLIAANHHLAALARAVRRSRPGANGPRRPPAGTVRIWQPVPAAPTTQRCLQDAQPAARPDAFLCSPATYWGVQKPRPARLHAMAPGLVGQTIEQAAGHPGCGPRVSSPRPSQRSVDNSHGPVCGLVCPATPSGYRGRERRAAVRRVEDLWVTSGAMAMGLAVLAHLRGWEFSPPVALGGCIDASAPGLDHSLGIGSTEGP
jgi:hypothetical protein